MTKNDGKDLERVVELLERSLDPAARIKQNVPMPVLSSQIGATVHCDVVVWSHQGAREFITIIEVQDRTRQMLPNDVRGFVEKMKDVGAQRVVCVSKMDFSKSVKEKAAQSGGTLILIVVNDWGIDSLPLEFVRVEPSYAEFNLTEATNVHIIFSKNQVAGIDKKELNFPSLKPTKEIFSYDCENMFSLSTLCKNYSDQNYKKASSGENMLDTEKDDEPQLHVLIKDIFHRIEIRLAYKYEWVVTEIKPHILSYEQDGHGTIAWYLEAQHQAKDGLVKMKIPIVKAGDKFVINQVGLEMPKNHTFSINVVKNAPDLT